MGMQCFLKTGARTFDDRCYSNVKIDWQLSRTKSLHDGKRLEKC